MDNQYRADRPLADAALAAAVALLLVITARSAPVATNHLDPAAYLVLGVSAVALVARRRAPVAVLAVTTVGVFAYQLRDYPGVITALPVLIAAYTTVDVGRRAATAAAGAVLLLGVPAAALAGLGGPPTDQLLEGRILLAGWFVAAAVAGEVSRKHRAYLHEVERRAEEAELARDEIARRQAGDERLRIARELHDSLTHSLSVIKVQASVAVHLARKHGDEVPEALLAIEEASRDATRELRATLDLLRTTGDAGVDVSGTNGSAPGGLDRLPDLVDRARATGLATTVTVTGTRRDLPAEVDLAGYRIIQEALTNTTRHAGAAEAAVRLTYDGGVFVVQVDDDGNASPTAAAVPGVGLTGMRERVEALGGRLDAAPRPEGGFRVRAELPVPDDPS